MLLVSDEVVDPSGEMPGGGVRCPVGCLPGTGGFPTPPPPPLLPPPTPPPPPPPAAAGGSGIKAWNIGAWVPLCGWEGMTTVLRGMGMSLKKGTLASLESCCACRRLDRLLF